MPSKFILFHFISFCFVSFHFIGCATRDAGSSLTRDQTLHWERGVLTTGLPGKSLPGKLKYQISTSEVRERRKQKENWVFILKCSTLGRQFAQRLRTQTLEPDLPGFESNFPYCLCDFGHISYLFFASASASVKWKTA